MVQPVIVDVSPNKENITFNCMAIPNEKEAVSHLKWIADMVAEKGKETPQTIVFCNTFNDISTILSYLLLVLKEKAFIDHNGKRTSLLGVYHAKSPPPFFPQSPARVLFSLSPFCSRRPYYLRAWNRLS